MPSFFGFKKLRFYNRLKSEKGSIIATLGITTAILGISLAVGTYVLNSQKLQKMVSSENAGRLLNNLVLTRVAQAISSTAVLCNNVTQLCYWNKATDGIAPENFRFSSIVPSPSAGEPMKFDVEVCLPEFTVAGPNLTDCQEKLAQVEVRIKDISELLGTDSATNQVGVISGNNSRDSADDKDSYGLLITVASKYKDFNQEDKVLTSTAVVRRPRLLLRLETDDAFCSPTCQVSVLSDGENSITKSQDFCFGRTKIVNNNSAAYTFNSSSGSNTSALSAFNSTNATIGYRIINDGPGYLYGYKIQRSFKPNPQFQFAPGESMPPVTQVFSSFDEKDKSELEIGPGGTKTYNDQGLKCYDEKITNTTVIEKFNTITNTTRMNDTEALGHTLHNHAFDGGAVWSRSFTPFELQSSVTVIDNITASPSNPKPSGFVTYSYTQVEPSNALSLGVAIENSTGTSTTTQQTQTNSFTREENVLVLVNTGMN